MDTNVSSGLRDGCLYSLAGLIYAVLGGGALIGLISAANGDATGLAAGIAFMIAMAALYLIQYLFEILTACRQHLANIEAALRGR